MSNGFQTPDKTCFDCGAFYPQWASVTYAVVFCLECSGQHRSLGTHISFVRSLGMDKWTDEQLKRMKMGGNAKAKEFFTAHRDWREGMTIPQKYNSEFARLYKDKLTAECEGRVWTMPDEATLEAMRRQQQQPQRPPSSASGNQPNAFGSGGQSSNTFRVNDDYFAKKGMENENRPANLPPSQGGKYAGFGSTYTPPPQPTDLLSDPIQALSKGWSLFASTVSKASEIAVTSAEQIGATLNESVIKPTQTALADPELTKNLGGAVSALGQKVTESSQMGFTFVQKVVSTVTSDHPGASDDGGDDDWADLLRKAEGLKKPLFEAPPDTDLAPSKTSYGATTGGATNDGWGDSWGNETAGEHARESVSVKNVGPVHNDGKQKKSDWDTDDTWEEF